MNDRVGGQVDFMCDQTTNTVPQIKAGNIKVYGVTTPARLASLPDVPTLEEQGLKGFKLVVWNGLFAPRGTPRPPPDKLTSPCRPRGRIRRSRPAWRSSAPSRCRPPRRRPSR